MKTSVLKCRQLGPGLRNWPGVCYSRGSRRRTPKETTEEEISLDAAAVALFLPRMTFSLPTENKETKLKVFLCAEGVSFCIFSCLTPSISTHFKKCSPREPTMLASLTRKNRISFVCDTGLVLLLCWHGSSRPSLCESANNRGFCFVRQQRCKKRVCLFTSCIPFTSPTGSFTRRIF